MSVRLGRSPHTGSDGAKKKASDGLQKTSIGTAGGFLKGLGSRIATSSGLLGPTPSNHCLVPKVGALNFGVCPSHLISLQNVLSLTQPHNKLPMTETHCSPKGPSHLFPVAWVPHKGFWIITFWEDPCLAD